MRFYVSSAGLDGMVRSISRVFINFFQSGNSTELFLTIGLVVGPDQSLVIALARVSRKILVAEADTASVVPIPATAGFGVRLKAGIAAMFARAITNCFYFDGQRLKEGKMGQY